MNGKLTLEYCQKYATPVDAETVQLIHKLKYKLKDQFGCDFAYMIMGKGHYVAANCMSPGEVNPVTRA